MTILVAVKKNGRTYLGADRITTFGNTYATDLVDGTKIMKLKHGYLATSGYTLLDNVIEHLYKSNHKLMDNKFADRSEVFSFFLELYNEMKKSYKLVDSGKDTYASFYNVFLAVTPTAIFGVNANLSVHEYEHFAVRGAGSDYALGCLYGTYGLFDDGFEITRMALEAACHFSIYCKEPLDIIEVTARGFGKTSRDGHKAMGGALTTLSTRKGVGDLIAIARASTGSFQTKTKSVVKRKGAGSVGTAKMSRNGAAPKRKKRRR